MKKKKATPDKSAVQALSELRPHLPPEPVYRMPDSVITPASQRAFDGTELDPDFCRADEVLPMAAADRAWWEEQKRQWFTPEMHEKFHDETRKMFANYVWGSHAHPDRITTGQEGEE